MPESQPVGSPDIVRSLPSWPTDAIRLLVARLIRGRPDALRPPLYTSSLLLSWKSCIDAQTPQDWGQFGSIKSFFASHALVGSCAQLGQSEYLSSQASVHTPHISGHSFITDDGFVPHSCSPQMWHCLLRAAGKGSVRRRGQARRCAASAARRGELRWRAGEAGRTARAGPNLRRRPVAP